MTYPFVEALTEVGCFARYEKVTDRMIRTHPALFSRASGDFFGLRSVSHGPVTGGPVAPRIAIGKIRQIPSVITAAGLPGRIERARRGTCVGVPREKL
jgi:hypothetical protein